MSDELENETFCPSTYMLLSETVRQGKLYFQSHTGNIYPSTPETSMVASREIGQAYSATKFRDALRTTAEDPTCPRQRIPDGCDNCGRKVVSYQRVGENKTVFYSCPCGNNWHN